MDPSFRAVVLGVRHMNHYILKEFDTINAERYQALEKVLQRSYSKRDKSKDAFKVGSYVSAYVTFGTGNGPKLWLRGIVRENYHQKNFLYGVHFGDYGFDKTCHKSDMRELLPYHYPDYVPFQEFNFFLTDVDHKTDANRESVLEEIRNLFESKDFIVLVTVEGRDRKGALYGSIQIDEDSDLAAILLDKELVIDAHYCHRYSHRKNVTLNESELTPKENVGPRPPGPFRSGSKASRANTYDVVCKCEAVIKYKRKVLSEKLAKIDSKNKRGLEERPVSEIFYNSV